MQSTVSIIVPAYNAGDTLNRCIESILAQDYSFIEIVIVDDGSTDSSLSIARNYENAHQNIRVLSQNNYGVSTARNVGLQIASGEFIQFVDSDDYLEPGATRTLVQLFDSEVELGIASYVGSGVDSTELPREYLLPIPIEGKVSRDEFLQKHLQYFIRDGHNVNKLYKANIIKEQNIAFPEELPFHEDLVFNLRYLKHVTNIALTKTPIYNIENEPSSAVLSFHQIGDKAVRFIYAGLDSLLGNIELEAKPSTELTQLKLGFAIGAIRNIAHPKNTQTIKDQILEIDELINHPSVQGLAQTVIAPRPLIRVLAILIRRKHPVMLWAIWRLNHLLKKPKP